MLVNLYWPNDDVFVKRAAQALHHPASAALELARAELDWAADGGEKVQYG